MGRCDWTPGQDLGLLDFVMVLKFLLASFFYSSRRLNLGHGIYDEARHLVL
jgi:hypothetical protein